MIFGELICLLACTHSDYKSISSFEPNADKTCEDLLNLALRNVPNSVETLQMFASVRMSQQRPDEAKKYLEEAWIAFKDLDLGQDHFHHSPIDLFF